MIKTELRREFPNQYNSIKKFSTDIFITDYTEQTKRDKIKRAVEFFAPSPPKDIDCFVIKNKHQISIDGIIFNNKSFLFPDGNPKTQCEVVLFPTNSDSNSWILLNELKYSSKSYNNIHNLLKAERQLLSTHEYYEERGVVSISNTSYLIASMPQQSEPFRHFRVSPHKLASLKRERNIILRFTNMVEIVDNYKINT